MGADFFFFYLGPNVSDGSQHRSSTSHQHWAYPAWLHRSLNRTRWTQCTSTLNGSQRLPLKAKEQQNKSNNTLCKNWPDRMEIWPTGATIEKTFWRTSKDVWQTVLLMTHADIDTLQMLTIGEVILSLKYNSLPYQRWKYGTLCV